MKSSLCDYVKKIEVINIKFPQYIMVAYRGNAKQWYFPKEFNGITRGRLFEIYQKMS